MAVQGGSRGVVDPGERPAGWGLAAALALLALALLLALQGGPPPAQPASAPATEFSAGRAQAVLRDLLGDGAPHPVGSPAAARVRERILAELRSVGLTPEVQESVGCSPAGICARVSNVLARLPGREPGKSVLLLAHYDSVAAGPGVSDDLAGVAAVLEAAGAPKAAPPPRHGVLFLLDEGEEPGLLGARAFAEQSPAMAEVGAVVNLDARGTAGPSLLFETSGPDAWMVRDFAAQAAHPFTNSVFPTAYQYLPNDTDLSVFKQRGIPGLSFAFIERPLQYHSPLDNLADLSAASLQHHGENALAAVRGLADGDLARPPQGRAVYFDLFHATVVRWPAGLSALLGLLALALVLGAAFLFRRRGLPAWGAGFMLGLGAPLSALLLLLVLGIAFQFLIAPAFPAPWTANPGPAIATFWLLALGGGLGLAGLMGRRAGLPGLWAGVWGFWALLGLLVGIALPGISYLILVPALGAGVCGLALGGSPAGRTLAAVVPAFVAALLWLEILGMLYAGLGLTGLLVTAVLLAMVLSTLTPLMAGVGPWARRWLPLAALLLAVVCLIWARMLPPFSPKSPHDVAIMAHEAAASGETRLVLRGGPPIPPSMLRAAAFGKERVSPFPWSPPTSRLFVSPAPPLGAPGPDLAVLSDSNTGGQRHLRLRLTSARGARSATVLIPPQVKVSSVQVDGETVPLGGGGKAGAPPPPAGWWQAITYLTVAPQGATLDVVLDTTEPNDWYVYDHTYDLPPSAQGVKAARPAWSAALHDGDGTFVSRKVRI